MVVVVVTDANMVACGLSSDGREAFEGFRACCRQVLNSCGDLRADTVVMPTTTLTALIRRLTVLGDVVLLQADKVSP